MIPLLSAKAWKGTITASSLNMRKSNSSESRVLKTLREGTTVEVLSSSGGWYKVKAGGTTGYVSKKYVKKASSSDSSSSGKSSSSSSSSSTCSVGDSGVAVKAVQKKLKSLGYYSGSVDGDYGAGTKKAVMAFQKANGLKQTGNVNSATLKKMRAQTNGQCEQRDPEENEQCRVFLRKEILLRLLLGQRGGSVFSG